jgi:hypothetical protein
MITIQPSLKIVAPHLDKDIKAERLKGFAYDGDEGLWAIPHIHEQAFGTMSLPQRSRLREVGGSVEITLNGTVRKSPARFLLCCGSHTIKQEGKGNQFLHLRTE